MSDKMRKMVQRISDASAYLELKQFVCVDFKRDNGMTARMSDIIPQMKRLQREQRKEKKMTDTPIRLKKDLEKYEKVSEASANTRRKVSELINDGHLELMTGLKIAYSNENSLSVLDIKATAHEMIVGLDFIGPEAKKDLIAFNRFRNIIVHSNTNSTLYMFKDEDFELIYSNLQDVDAFIDDLRWEYREQIAIHDVQLEYTFEHRDEDEVKDILRFSDAIEAIGGVYSEEDNTVSLEGVPTTGRLYNSVKRLIDVSI